MKKKTRNELEDRQKEAYEEEETPGLEKTVTNHTRFISSFALLRKQCIRWVSPEINVPGEPLVGSLASRHF